MQNLSFSLYNIRIVYSASARQVNPAELLRMRKSAEYRVRVKKKKKRGGEEKKKNEIYLPAPSGRRGDFRRRVMKKDRPCVQLADAQAQT